MYTDFILFSLFLINFPIPIPIPTLCPLYSYNPPISVQVIHFHVSSALGLVPPRISASKRRFSIERQLAHSRLALSTSPWEIFVFTSFQNSVLLLLLYVPICTILAYFDLLDHLTGQLEPYRAPLGFLSRSFRSAQRACISSALQSRLGI